MSNLMNPSDGGINVSSLWSSMDGEISVHYFQFYRFHCLEHVHGEFSINIPLGGPLSYRIGDSIESVLPGSVLVIQPGEWHTGVDLSQGITISVSERSLTALCSAIHLKRDAADKEVSISRFVKDERLSSLAQDLAHEMRHASIGRDIVITSLVNQYLIYLLRGWAVPSEQPLQSSRYLPVTEMLRAIEYMNYCPKSSFSLRSISTTIGTSQSRFVALFSASTGSSPLAFYNRILIQKAKQLLVQSDMPIKEVAFTLDFQSEAHFCNLFRTISGTSPTACRSNGSVAPLYSYNLRRLKTATA
jgi:AraC-like DNA-binding protein